MSAWYNHRTIRMTAFKRILVGVDGSHNSLRTARIAAEMASIYHSEIVLFHGLPPTARVVQFSKVPVMVVP